MIMAGDGEFHEPELAGFLPEMGTARLRRAIGGGRGKIGGW